MSTIAEQLALLAQIKADIKAAIQAKGVTVGDAAFDDYATLIASISSGGGGDDLKNVVQRSGSSLTLPSGITKIGQYALAYMPITSLVVPSGVTELVGYALNACTALTSIELPSTLTTIGAQVLGAAYLLDTIICHATTPPTANAQAFGSTANNCAGKNVSGTKTLYVPSGCKSAYQSATNGWTFLFQADRCNFTIEELDQNGQIPQPQS